MSYCKPARISRVITLLALGVLMAAQATLAQSRCTGEQIAKMIGAGFTKDEILGLCGESEPRTPQQPQERSPSGAQNRTLANLLAGHQWKIRSKSLVFASLVATFNSSGSFAGMIQTVPGDILHKPGPMNGRWQVAGPLLFLNYFSVMMGQPTQNEHGIEISQASENKLIGVDKFFRLWELERMN